MCICNNMNVCRIHLLPRRSCVIDRDSNLVCRTFCFDVNSGVGNWSGTKIDVVRQGVHDDRLTLGQYPIGHDDFDSFVFLFSNDAVNSANTKYCSDFVQWF